MNFDLSDEQIQLQNAVQRWASKSYTFDHDCANYAQLADLGLTGLLGEVSKRMQETAGVFS